MTRYLPSSHSLDCPPTQTPSFNASHSCLAVNFPKQCLGLLQKHLLHILRADQSHVHLHFVIKLCGIPLRPGKTQVAGVTSYGSCWCSYLNPHPDLHHLLLPRLFCGLQETLFQTVTRRLSFISPGHQHFFFFQVKLTHDSP